MHKVKEKRYSFGHVRDLHEIIKSIFDANLNASFYTSAPNHALNLPPNDLLDQILTIRLSKAEGTKVLQMIIFDLRYCKKLNKSF